MTPDMTSPIWFGSLAQWMQGAEWRVSLAHARDVHTLVLIKRGQGLGLLRGARHGLGTHNLLSLPPGCVFSMSLGKQGVGLVLQVQDPEAVRLPQTPWLLRLREVAAIGEATSLFEVGLRETEQARPLVHDALEAHARLLGVWLRRQLTLEDHLPAPMDKATELTARLFAQMGKTPPGLMTLSAHASALGVTPTHLSRACKQATGQTAATLLNEQVLHQARLLLADPSIEVQDIARHLGFGTPSYFTRFIKTHTGQAPSHWRST